MILWNYISINTNTLILIGIDPKAGLKAKIETEQEITNYFALIISTKISYMRPFAHIAITFEHNIVSTQPSCIIDLFSKIARKIMLAIRINSITSHQ